MAATYSVRMSETSLSPIILTEVMRKSTIYPVERPLAPSLLESNVYEFVDISVIGILVKVPVCPISW
jgi:hypothetical protein